MTIAFQLAIFAYIATSSILLISVSVVFASPDGWSSNKNVVFFGTLLWIGLIFLVGIYIRSSIEPFQYFLDQRPPPRRNSSCGTH